MEAHLIHRVFEEREIFAAGQNIIESLSRGFHLIIFRTRHCIGRQQHLINDKNCAVKSRNIRLDDIRAIDRQRIAVLCDVVGSLDPKVARPLQPALEKVLTELNGLDIALRRRNVDLSLDLAQADRRLRAQMAYGGKSDEKKK